MLTPSRRSNCCTRRLSATLVDQPLDQKFIRQLCSCVDCLFSPVKQVKSARDRTAKSTTGASDAISLTIPRKTRRKHASEHHFPRATFRSFALGLRVPLRRCLTQPQVFAPMSRGVRHRAGAPTGAGIARPRTFVRRPPERRFDHEGCGFGADRPSKQPSREFSSNIFGSPEINFLLGEECCLHFADHFAFGRRRLSPVTNLASLPAMGFSS